MDQNNNNNNQTVAEVTKEKVTYRQPDPTQQVVENLTKNYVVTMDGEQVSAPQQTQDTQTQTDPTNSADQQQQQPQQQIQTQEQELENKFAANKSAEEDLKKDLNEKGIDYEQVAREYEENQELSKNTLDKLEKAGYPKSVINAYIAGLDALADQYARKITDYAGGTETYGRMIDYLKQQPQAVRDGFNDAIQTGSFAQIQLAIDGIKAKMTATHGTSNPSIMAGGGSKGGGGSYSSLTDLSSAMNDPRYGKDQKYTQEVMNKIKQSELFSVMM